MPVMIMMMSTGHGHGHGPGFTQSRHGRTQSRSEVTRRDGSAGYGTEPEKSLSQVTRAGPCGSAAPLPPPPCAAGKSCMQKLKNMISRQAACRFCESHIYLMEMLDPILFDQNLNSKSRKATNQPNLLLGTSITMMMLLVYLQPAILKCNSTTSGCCSD